MVIAQEHQVYTQINRACAAQSPEMLEGIEQPVTQSVSNNKKVEQRIHSVFE